MYRLPQSRFRTMSDDRSYSIFTFGQNYIYDIYEYMCVSVCVCACRGPIEGGEGGGGRVVSCHQNILNPRHSQVFQP